MNLDIHAATPPKFHICAKCKTQTDEIALRTAEYRCPTCNFEMAHPDVAPNGTIRGVFGYLRTVGDLIQERYRVENVLGKGGFGATYLVEDIKLKGKHRALKEIPELVFDEHEVHLLSQLRHPSIPDIVDRCVDDGMVYLVLEFGGTRTLEDECRRAGGRVPLAALVPWMRQICDALTYLHSQKPPVVHRDLKPENILLDENEHVMLIDFGIAKESSPSNTTRTTARAVSHGFSPPEQVLGTGTDQRSDIYSLGATFYYLISGIVPPPAHERVAGAELRPVSELVSGVPPVTQDLLLSALSLNINNRPRNVEEFRPAVDALELSPSEFYQSSRTVMAHSVPEIATGLPSGKVIQGVNISTGEPVLPVVGGLKDKEKTRRPLWQPLSVGAIVLAALCALGLFYWHARGKNAPAATRTTNASTVKHNVVPGKNHGVQTLGGGMSTPGAPGSIGGRTPIAGAPAGSVPPSAAGGAAAAPAGGMAGPAFNNAPATNGPPPQNSQPNALQILEQQRRTQEQTQAPSVPKSASNASEQAQAPSRAAAPGRSASQRRLDANQRFIKRVAPLLTNSPRSNGFVELPGFPHTGHFRAPRPYMYRYGHDRRF